jgi:tetratricopeptide (TPR) repeat protein
MNRMVYRGGGRGEQIAGGPLGQARYALATGNYDKAEAICRKRLEKNADDVSARVLLSQALLQQHLIDDAVAEARRATQIQPSNTDAQLALASSLLQKSGPMGMGRVPPEAERAARRAVQLQPRTAKTHVQLAEILAAKRDYSGARLEAEEACRLEPRLAGAHLMRAVVLLSDKDPSGAVEAANAALRNDRSVTQAEFVKANAYMELKQYDEALDALETVDRQAPYLGGSNTDALRGRIYYKQRKIKQSYGIFRKLQAANPRFRWLAPVIAGVSMFLVGQFGQDAQFAIVVLLVVVVALILFGLHFIPVVGGWIVAALGLGIVGLLAFGALRQLSGSVLPRGGMRLPALGGAIVAGLAVFMLAIFVLGLIFGRGSFGPVELFVAGALALAGAAGITYLLGRYGGRAVAG